MQYKYMIKVRDNNKTVIFTNNKNSKRAKKFTKRYWCIITQLHK